MTNPTISALKDKLNTSTLHLALLSIATGGVYPLLWLYKHQDTIMMETDKAFSSRVMVIWMAVCFGIAGVLRPMIAPDSYGYTDPTSDTLSILVGLLFIANSALCIVWAFRARAALQHYALTQFRFELKMSPVWTALFSLYYICRCINAMPDELAKHQIIHGKPLTTETL